MNHKLFTPRLLCYCSMPLRLLSLGLREFITHIALIRKNYCELQSININILKTDFKRDCLVTIRRIIRINSYAIVTQIRTAKWLKNSKLNIVRYYVNRVND